MRLLPRRSTRTDTPFPSTPLFRAIRGVAVGRRLLRGWEAYLPSSATKPELRVRAISEARARFAAARAVSPELHEMHPLDADGIEEFTPLLQHSLECLQWAMLLAAPSYVECLPATRRTAAYRTQAVHLTPVTTRRNQKLLT